VVVASRARASYRVLSCAAHRQGVEKSEDFVEADPVGTLERLGVAHEPDVVIESLRRLNDPLRGNLQEKSAIHSTLRP
jgi:hypothetical protein